jgi:hypothetical protein
VVKHHQPMVDRLQRKKAPVEASSIPCPSSFARNVDHCQTTCMQMEVASICAAQWSSRPIFIQQRHRSGVFINPLQLKSEMRNMLARSLVIGVSVSFTTMHPRGDFGAWMRPEAQLMYSIKPLCARCGWLDKLPVYANNSCGSGTSHPSHG